MNNFDIYNMISDLQLEAESCVVHLYRTWPAAFDKFNHCALKIKNLQYPGKLIITDDSIADNIEILSNKFYFGIPTAEYHMSTIAIDVRALYNCSCLSFDLSVRNIYRIERETRIILTGLNRPVDMRIERVRDYMIQLQTLLFSLYNIFNDKQKHRLYFDSDNVYATYTVQFFADLYLRFHETDFRMFNMDNSFLFKHCIYEYSPEELERIISVCTNTELMEEYITSEHSSGECKAIVIKRMAELGIDKNRFDL